jgi:hypothetical protein
MVVMLYFQVIIADVKDEGCEGRKEGRDISDIYEEEKLEKI